MLDLIIDDFLIFHLKERMCISYRSIIFKITLATLYHNHMLVHFSLLLDDETLMGETALFASVFPGSKHSAWHTGSTQILVEVKKNKC